MRLTALTLAAFLAVPSLARAQKAPPSRYFEDLTFNEIHDLIAAGYKTIIIPTGGTEDKGPHMAMGEHNRVVEYNADQIAMRLGNALVAPVIAYVPEGDWDKATGHMSHAGSITLPDDKGYTTLLEAAALSFKQAGFKNIVFIGDSGGNQAGMKATADKLGAAWAGEGVKVLHLPDYYTKAHADTEKWIVANLKIPQKEIGGHANIEDTSELMWVNPSLVHMDRLEKGTPENAISGDARPSTPALGEQFNRIKIENAVAQYRALMGMPAQPASTAKLMQPYPAKTEIAVQAIATPAPGSIVPSYWIEELTFYEVRDALKAGMNVAIVPTGGTEKNGYHMTTGKHNFHVRAGASLMAQELGNALIAPVVQYVPESPASIDNPAVLSCRDECFDNILIAAARSLKAGGFKDIILIGDNGGNQGDIAKVADMLNKEWAGTDVKVFGCTDYYEKGHEHLESYLMGVYGWTLDQIGSHAGIQDTSQMEWVKPYDVRMDQIEHSYMDKKGSSVSGDPTKSTPEFGRIAISFKADAGVQQYKALKAPRRGRGGPPPTGGGR